MSDPLKPSVSLLSKLGSIAVHAEELFSSDGHPFDKDAIQTLLSDAEVQNWIREMGVYLPVQRRKPATGFGYNEWAEKALR